MNPQNASASAILSVRPNGAGAAAILAAGVGAFLVAVFAILADQSAAIKSLMIFWKPTGPLSGVTTCAIVLWIASWAILQHALAQPERCARARQCRGLCVAHFRVAAHVSTDRGSLLKSALHPVRLPVS